MVQDRRAYGIDGSNRPALYSVGQWVDPLANGSKTGWFGTVGVSKCIHLENSSLPEYGAAAGARSVNLYVWGVKMYVVNRKMLV